MREDLIVDCPNCWKNGIEVSLINGVYVTESSCDKCGTTSSRIEKVLNSSGRGKRFTVEKGYISKDLKKGGV